MAAPIGQPRIRLPAQIRAGEVIEIRTLITHVMETGQRKDQAGAAVPRVAEHELNLAFEANLFKRLNGELSITHVAGRPNSTSPAQPMPDYTVVDLGLEYSMTESAVAYIKAHNLFDEQYQQVAGYGTSGRTFFAGLRADF